MLMDQHQNWEFFYVNGVAWERRKFRSMMMIRWLRIGNRGQKPLDTLFFCAEWFMFGVGASPNSTPEWRAQLFSSWTCSLEYNGVIDQHNPTGRERSCRLCVLLSWYAENIAAHTTSDSEWTQYRTNSAAGHLNQCLRMSRPFFSGFPQGSHKPSGVAASHWKASRLNHGVTGVRRSGIP